MLDNAVRTQLNRSPEGAITIFSYFHSLFHSINCSFIHARAWNGRAGDRMEIGKNRMEVAQLQWMTLLRFRYCLMSLYICNVNRTTISHTIYTVNKTETWMKLATLSTLH